MKHFEQTLTTYVYSYCNMCNIPIYFYNIHMQHLQYISETLKHTLATYASSRETISWPAMTFTWWRRGGGGAVHAVAVKASAEWGDGHGGEEEWRDTA
jgi:hypothetical protein